MMDKLLRNNNAVKVVALFLAIALWFSVNGGEPRGAPRHSQPIETYRISEVNLTAKYDSNRLAIVEIPKTVSVELQGTPYSLSRHFPPTDYEVYVDLTNYQKGTWKVPVRHEGFPRGLSVRVIPEEVEVVLEEKQTVERDVVARFVGDVAEGYSIGEAIVSPKKVHVALPESQIPQIGQVEALVNIEAAREAIELTVPVRVLDKRGNLMDADVTPSAVEVRAPVTSPFKQVPVKLNFANESPPGYSVEEIRVLNDEIVVYGPLEAIEPLEVYPGPEIDLSQIKEDRFMQLKLPLLPNVTKVEPEFIELEMKVTPATERTLENVPISINGLGKNLKAVFVQPENGTLPITVQGSGRQIKELTNDDIQLYIDSSHLPPGEHRTPVLINLPTFISLKEGAQPLQAVIRIEKTAE